MRPEQFAREARRWTADHQADGGESEYSRQRAKRCLRIWNDDDDGMVHLRGQFDPVTGKRIANRLREAAGRLHDADKTAAEDGAERRSFDQCMADAVDQLTSATNLLGGNGGGKSFADICVVAHVDDDTGEPRIRTRFRTSTACVRTSHQQARPNRTLITPACLRTATNKRSRAGPALE